jgi:hypothetical protein
MLQCNQAMEMIMSTNHSHTASDWLSHTDMPTWTKRFGDTVRTVFEAVDTGRTASHDYQRLTTRGVPPQHATDNVFRKHFGN